MFVDHGLLRLHEGDAVMKIFAQNLGVKVIRVDADPERKRKIIGAEFVQVFDMVRTGRIRES